MRYLALPLCVFLAFVGLSAHSAKPGSGGDTTIETRVTDLEAAVADNAARLDAEEAATAAADGRISTLESSSAATDTRVTAVESGVAAVQAEVTGNGDRLTAVEDAAAGTDAAISNLDARVGALEAGGGGGSASGFIGATAALINGTQGFGGMQEACVVEYGTGAHICSEKEILDDPNFVPSNIQTTATFAWLKPTVVGAAYNGAPQPNIVTYSGLWANVQMSCGPSGRYQTVYYIDDGFFSISVCANDAAVMCCR